MTITVTINLQKVTRQDLLWLITLVHELNVYLADLKLEVNKDYRYSVNKSFENITFEFDELNSKYATAFTFKFGKYIW